MAGPQTVDSLVDGTTIAHASQLQWVQRAVVGPAFYNVKSDLYAGANLTTEAASAATDTGNTGGLLVIPTSITGMVPPAAPTVTPTGGVAGTYAYIVLALNGIGEVVSLPTVITNGPTTLDATHFNAVSWGLVAGATSYKLVRMIGGATTGVVFSGTATSFNDQGTAGTNYGYVNPSVSTLPQNITVLDMRYLPTSQPAALARSGVTNQWQVGQFYLARRADVGNDNFSTLAVDVLATGGQSSGSGDGENVGVYAGASRTAGSRGIWSANFNTLTSVAPAATMVTYGLEIDVTNNSGTDATTSTPLDGLVITNFGASKSRFGIHINSSSAPTWLVPIQIDGGPATVQGLSIQGITAGSIRITPANDLATNNEIFGSNAANNAVVWQVNNDGSAQFNTVFFDSGAAQSRMRSGTGVPTGGNSGDFYLRKDGGGAGATHLYFNNAGTWIGVA